MPTIDLGSNVGEYFPEFRFRHGILQLLLPVPEIIIHAVLAGVPVKTGMSLFEYVLVNSVVVLDLGKGIFFIWRKR